MKFVITTTDAKGRALLRAGELEAKRRGLDSVGDLVALFLATYTPEHIAEQIAKINSATARDSGGRDTTPPTLEPDTAEALRAFLTRTAGETGLTPSRIYSDLVHGAIKNAARATRAARLADRENYDTVALPAATVRQAEAYAERRGYSLEGVISRATIDYLDRRGDTPRVFSLETNDETGRMRERYNKGLQMSGQAPANFERRVIDRGLTVVMAAIREQQRRDATPGGVAKRGI